MSSLFDDADSKPSDDEQFDLFDTSDLPGSNVSDLDESSYTRDARDIKKAILTDKSSSKKVSSKHDSDDISDSQAQLDSLLGGMQDSSNKKPQSQRSSGLVPEVFRKTGII